jgi:hypothetical protein
VKDLALRVGEDLFNRCLMASIDHLAGLSIGQRPSHRHALGGTECEVETAHGPGDRSPAEHFASDGISAVLEHPLEVLRGHRLAYFDAFAVVKTDEAGAQKDAWGSAGFAVVANQIGLARPVGTITHGDRFEKIFEARANAEAPNGHHVESS